MAVHTYLDAKQLQFSELAQVLQASDLVLSKEEALQIDQRIQAINLLCREHVTQPPAPHSLAHPRMSPNPRHHTHSHAHVCVDTYVHAHMHTPHTHMHATHTHARTCTHTLAHPRMHTHAHTCTSTHAHVHGHARARTRHTRTHTPTHAYARTHTHIHARMRACTHGCTHPPLTLILLEPSSSMVRAGRGKSWSMRSSLFWIRNSRCSRTSGPRPEMWPMWLKERSKDLQGGVAEVGVSPSMGC